MIVCASEVTDMSNLLGRMYKSLPIREIKNEFEYNFVYIAYSDSGISVAYNYNNREFNVAMFDESNEPTKMIMLNKKDITMADNNFANTGYLGNIHVENGILKCNQYILGKPCDITTKLSFIHSLYRTKYETLKNRNENNNRVFLSDADYKGIKKMQNAMKSHKDKEAVLTLEDNGITLKTKDDSFILKIECPIIFAPVNIQWVRKYLVNINTLTRILECTNLELFLTQSSLEVIKYASTYTLYSNMEIKKYDEK